MFLNKLVYVKVQRIMNGDFKIFYCNMHTFKVRVGVGDGFFEESRTNILLNNIRRCALAYIDSYTSTTGEEKMPFICNVLIMSQSTLLHYRSVCATQVICLSLFSVH